MKKYIASILILLISCQGFSQSQKQKNILFIGAHPDDETALGEVLVKYAGLGYKVYIIIATDGKDGTRVTKVPAGDSLGNLRKQESICACAKMNIEPPLFLSIDRLDTRIGVRNYFNAHERLLILLKEKISSINPDIILTFGPDGDTHHSEHIVIGASVTELLLMEGWVEKFPLYYLAWTKEQGLKGELGYVNEQYFNVRVDYSQEDENKALEAMSCYVTQFTPEEIKEDKQRKMDDKVNTLFFRRFIVKKGIQADF